MSCMNSTEPLEIYMLPRQMGDPWPLPVGLKAEEAMTSAEINAESVCPLMTTNFHLERIITIPRDTTSLKEQANVWSPDNKPRLSSMSIVKHKDHMVKSTLMSPKWMRE